MHNCTIQCNLPAIGNPSDEDARMQGFPSTEEEEEESYIHVPSPIGLIGWNIQKPKVFQGVTCPSRALPSNARTFDIAWSTILLLKFSLIKQTQTTSYIHHNTMLIFVCKKRRISKAT